MRTHVLRVGRRFAESDDLDLVRGTQASDALRLALDAEWSGLDVSVTFFGSDTKVTPGPEADGTYVFPWEVLTSPGPVEVAVEGRADGVLLAHAAMRVPFRCRESLSPAVATGPEDPTVTELQAAKRDALAARITAAVADTLPPGSGATAQLVQGTDGQTLVLGIPSVKADFATFSVGDDMMLAARYTDGLKEIIFALDGPYMKAVYA